MISKTSTTWEIKYDNADKSKGYIDPIILRDSKGTRGDKFHGMQNYMQSKPNMKAAEKGIQSYAYSILKSWIISR